MSAWYSSLWVVVEGWTQVPLSDPFVDELLDASPRYKDLLRRYRNGVYHYQPRFNERRLLDFIHESEGTVEWTFFLHMEFCRFYWELVESVPADHRAKLRETIIGIVGWIPSDIPTARAQSIRELKQQAISMLREAGDFSSPEARDLLRVVHEGVDEAAKLEGEFQNWRAEVLERIKRLESAKR
jgi:hypothetical protein